MAGPQGAGPVPSAHTSTHRKSLVSGGPWTGGQGRTREETHRFQRMRHGRVFLSGSAPSSSSTATADASMSAAEGGGQGEEGEYGRAAKRLKTEERETEAEEREEGEEELEEGEDSDSGSLSADGETAADNRARWSAREYEGGRKVRMERETSDIPQSSITHDRGVSALLAVARRIAPAKRHRTPRSKAAPPTKITTTQKPELIYFHSLIQFSTPRCKVFNLKMMVKL